MERFVTVPSSQAGRWCPEAATAAPCTRSAWVSEMPGIYRLETSPIPGGGKVSVSGGAREVKVAFDRFKANSRGWCLTAGRAGFSYPPGGSSKTVVPRKR